MRENFQFVRTTGELTLAILLRCDLQNFLLVFRLLCKRRVHVNTTTGSHRQYGRRYPKMSIQVAVGFEKGLWIGYLWRSRRIKKVSVSIELLLIFSVIFIVSANFAVLPQKSSVKFYCGVEMRETWTECDYDEIYSPAVPRKPGKSWATFVEPSLCDSFHAALANESRKWNVEFNNCNMLIAPESTASELRKILLIVIFLQWFRGWGKLSQPILKIWASLEKSPTVSFNNSQKSLAGSREFAKARFWKTEFLKNLEFPCSPHSPFPFFPVLHKNNAYIIFVTKLGKNPWNISAHILKIYCVTQIWKKKPHNFRIACLPVTIKILLKLLLNERNLGISKIRLTCKFFGYYFGENVYDIFW